MMTWTSRLVSIIVLFHYLPLCCSSIEYIFKPNLLSDVSESFQLVSFTNLLTKSRYLDLVFAGPNHDSLTVRSYDAQNQTYNLPPGYHYSFQYDSELSDFKIIGVLPADFNNDKWTDLMVVFANIHGQYNYKLVILWNKENGFYSTTHLNATFSDVPHLLDYDGNLFIDFICAEGNTRYFYINDKNNPGTFSNNNRIQIVEADGEEPFEIDLTKGETSYAYGDLNGDCEADLFMVTKLKNGSSIFELYEANEKVLTKAWQVPVPEKAKADKYSAPLIEDMDGNGKMDIVLAGCSTVSESSNVCLESKIFIFYNDPCHSRSSDKCTIHQSNCKKYSFDIGKDVFVFDKFEHKDKVYGFLNFNPTTDMFSSRYMLRAADLDSNGNLDLVAILKTDNTQKPVVFINIDNSALPGGKTFRPEWRDDLMLGGDLAATYQPYALAPVDALGHGTVQLFLLGRNNDDDEQFALSVLTTKDMLDTFWLKVTVLCNECDNSSTTMVGANAFYFTTGYKGNDQVGYGSQNSQLAPFSLQAPYMLFGLGQQANYIEYVKVAYRNTLKEGKTLEMYQFDQLIPNAQVFAIPMKSMWKLVMMVVPGRTLWLTLLVLGVCCLVCLIIILVLHIKEKKEDEREKRKFNAKFNFDAM